VKARSLLSLLFHGAKAIDVVQAALALGILDRLDEGSASLRELSAMTRALPNRLYKLLDGLESLELVRREAAPDHAGILETRYVAAEPLADAARAVVGEASIERDRDRYRWRDIHGHLPEVVRGELAVTRDAFAWPPENDDQVRAFERSMAAGIAPIAETFRRAGDLLWRGPTRWLDVGGGDGSLVRDVLDHAPDVRADVYNLAAIEPLVRARAAPMGGRMGFVAGDFFAGELPGGYDVLSFVRVLHDWPDDVALELLAKARRALPSGGRIAICEEMRTPDRLALQFFWTYFLIGVDSCVSRLREIEFYVDALAALGFRDVATVEGPFDVVVAVAP